MAVQYAVDGPAEHRHNCPISMAFSVDGVQTEKKVVGWHEARGEDRAYPTAVTVEFGPLEYGEHKFGLYPTLLNHPCVRDGILHAWSGEVTVVTRSPLDKSES